ncbi:hypothetical protein PIROE2DRAFT_68076 [Piromyces sp. E2]|nr:hypothetical protein PIROE2DRAFT_68076 [Piromyces sp. E2]|eukprot:OUM66583.1 hypothetical protein PIROE2DRAFT_68076 [Piromyces sp. E2]
MNEIRYSLLHQGMGSTTSSPSIQVGWHHWKKILIYFTGTIGFLFIVVNPIRQKYEIPLNPLHSKHCTVSYDEHLPLIQYALMVDAGSTGSRIHIYRFNYCGPSPSLEDEVFREVKPGLSSYPNDPEAAADSLDPLLQAAVASVPVSLQSCTPIVVRATAGLRLLGREESEAILQALPEKDGVIVMNGKDEGIYAWITVNYLLERIGEEKKLDTVAIMDLGGGSTQIVFEPFFLKDNNDNRFHPFFEKEDKISNEDYRVELTFGHHNYVLYQHSYLGYGLLEARDDLYPVVNPCFPESFNYPLTLQDNKQAVKIIGSRRVNFKDCSRVIKSTLFNKTVLCRTEPCSFDGVYQPTTLFDISLNPKVEDIAELAGKICRHHHEYDWQTKNDPYLCLDLTYLYTLLNYGYSIHPSKKIFLAKKINEVEAGWCLGATLQMLDGMVHSENIM